MLKAQAAFAGISVNDLAAAGNILSILQDK
jgi:hypothetical protein